MPLSGHGAQERANRTDTPNSGLLCQITHDAVKECPFHKRTIVPKDNEKEFRFGPYDDFNETCVKYGTGTFLAILQGERMLEIACMMLNAYGV